MIRLRAPAKVNFFLEITGKRADGYHTLSTLFQTVSLYDRLSFASAESLVLTCSDPALPTDRRNIVLRAAEAVREALHERRGARIHLDKNIPMGAGLGGGSSDAAAVLKALPVLWKRRVPPVLLQRIAVQLGADVPFFLKGGLCAATGIGDRLKPLASLPKTWMVLVYPGFGVSTKEAYAKVELPYAQRKLSPKDFNYWISSLTKAAPRSRRPATGFEHRSSPLFNRFEELVFPGRPELPALKRQILESGADAALMSGSGSTVYGLFHSEARGRRSCAALRKKYPLSWLVQNI